MLTYFSFSVLATSVNKLVKVDLADTFITNEQMTHILHQVFGSKLLEYSFLFCLIVIYLGFARNQSGGTAHRRHESVVQ